MGNHASQRVETRDILYSEAMRIHLSNLCNLNFLTAAIAVAVFSVLSCSDLLAQYSLLDTSTPYIGISQRDVTAEDVQENGLDEAKGVVVLLAAPETPLFNAGVREGDVLIRWGDTELKTASHLKGLLDGDLEIGQTVDLEVMRDGESISMDLELTPMSVPQRIKAVEYLAENDNHEAAIFLYRTFWNGHEKVKVDEDRAMKWLLHAAVQGSPAAQAIMAVHYRTGVHVKQDLEKALRWYEQAAEGGLSSGYVGIGTIYYDSFKGEEKKPAKAAEAFKKAAQQNDPWAWFHLGRMYWTGDYLKRNDEKAVGCFRKGKDIGDLPAAKLYLGFAHESGRGVVRNYPAAFQYYRSAAEAGDSAACYAVGRFYYNGYATKKDVEEAAEWYEKAAKLGYTMAENDFALLLLFGSGVSKDEARAVELLRSAAKKGYVKSNTMLGQIYENGDGVKKDFKQAAENYVIAARAGDPSAQSALASMVLQGRYYQKDDTAALKWLQKAVEKNHPTAERLMGHMYEHGRAVPQDRAEAIAWYLKAADHGDKWSADHLKELQK
ncbi:hypothetical protein CKO51_24645 [Rhodopirellula sp. SM50]|nr:PDZ domain-containing protein [Rhodopirellula sp. SM50]PAY16828.1 hypothetical protein CKO51_24645 [Rhodopirellula sp. SM50]